MTYSVVRLHNGRRPNAKPDPNTVTKALDLIYDKALDGVPGFLSVEEMAKDYLEGPGSLEDKANTLVRYQVAKASTSGFLIGLGGVLTLPVMTPVNLSSVMYVQLRMVAAIAYMGEYDVRDDSLKTVCYACLCGNAAKDVLKGVGVTTGIKLNTQAIKRLSFEAIKRSTKPLAFA